MKVIFTKVNPSEEIKIGRTKFKKKRVTNYLGRRNKMTLTVAEPLNVSLEICSLVRRSKGRGKTPKPKPINICHQQPFAYFHIALIVQNLFTKYFSFFLKKNPIRLSPLFFSSYLSHFSQI